MTQDDLVDVIRRVRQLPPAELFADGTLTISQVTAEFHVGRTTAYSWMQLGLPYSTASGRRLLPRRAVVELLAAGLVGVEKPELQVA